MLWLIGQIAAFLLIAFAVGLIIGWLLRTVWPSNRARARQGELEAALERARGRISDLEAGLRSKRVAATAAAEQEEAARRRVEELEAILASLDSQTDVDTGEMRRLQHELDDAMRSIGSLESQLAGLEAGTDAAEAMAAERESVRAGLAAESDDEEAAPDQPGLFIVPDQDDDADESEEAAAPEPSEEELEAIRLEAVAEVTERFRQPDDIAADDLKRIRGIGPVLERLLHSMNIATYRQIAGFTEDDVDLVSAALGRAFPDRVRRDDWMGGARELLRQDQESED